MKKAATVALVRKLIDGSLTLRNSRENNQEETDWQA